MTPVESYRYCGRDFSLQDIDTIKKIISEDPNRNRNQISRIVCQNFKWFKQNGGLKEMSCRVALLRMQKDGIIQLPPPKHSGQVKKICRISFSAHTEPGFAVTQPVHLLPPLRIIQVTSKTQSKLRNEYIHRYHYLGFKPLPGAQLRYFVYSDEQLLALLGFGAAAWKTEPRDTFIGWSPHQRQQNLHLIVNNARFLILPWVNSKNLASKILSLSARRLQEDWIKIYNYAPVLIESFIQIDKFEGTCYKAANWVCAGITKGRGKLDRNNLCAIPKKSIWIYPLCKDFKEQLCS